MRAEMSLRHSFTVSSKGWFVDQRHALMRFEVVTSPCVACRNNSGPQNYLQLSCRLGNGSDQAISHTRDMPASLPLGHWPLTTRARDAPMPVHGVSRPSVPGPTVLRSPPAPPPARLEYFDYHEIESYSLTWRRTCTFQVVSPAAARPSGVCYGRVGRAGRAYDLARRKSSG